MGNAFRQWLMQKQHSDEVKGELVYLLSAAPNGYYQNLCMYMLLRH